MQIKGTGQKSEDWRRYLSLLLNYRRLISAVREFWMTSEGEISGFCQIWNLTCIKHMSTDLTLKCSGSKYFDTRLNTTAFELISRNVSVHMTSYAYFTKLDKVITWKKILKILPRCLYFSLIILKLSLSWLVGRGYEN